ncbi:MAG: hypothetical protein ICV60_24165 [Pyrinomonadaceae bacterium]|nr:hypothetical protein [Pyrinomonadaceae bacterium]
MATKKSSGARKAKAKKTKKPPTPLVPAVPPPDNPLLRFTEFDADREFHSKEMAEKRLEAFRHTQQMPTSEEEDSAATQTAPEQTTCTTQPDSKDED